MSERRENREKGGHAVRKRASVWNAMQDPERLTAVVSHCSNVSLVQQRWASGINWRIDSSRSSLRGSHSMSYIRSEEFPFGERTSAKDQLMIDTISDANCNLGSSAGRRRGLIVAVRANQLGSCVITGVGREGPAYAHISPPPGENEKAKTPSLLLCPPSGFGLCGAEHNPHFEGEGSC